MPTDSYLGLPREQDTSSHDLASGCQRSHPHDFTAAAETPAPPDEYRVWECGRCQDWTLVGALNCISCGWPRGAKCTCGIGNVANRAHTPACAASQVKTSPEWHCLCGAALESKDAPCPKGCRSALERRAQAAPVSNWNPSRVRDGWDCWTCGAFVTHKQDAAEVERDCVKPGCSSKGCP